MDFDQEEIEYRGILLKLLIMTIPWYSLYMTEHCQSLNNTACVIAYFKYNDLWYKVALFMISLIYIIKSVQSLFKALFEPPFPVIK